MFLNESVIVELKSFKKYFFLFHYYIEKFFLPGEACSTCTAVRLWSVCGLWSVCHYKKCNRDIVDVVVIEVDELDKGNLYWRRPKNEHGLKNEDKVNNEDNSQIGDI